MRKAVGQMKQALFILGMHRSGTSAIARLCNLLGYDLGASLMKPNADNVDGFWENAHIFEIHEQIFEAIGADWSDFIPLKDNWYSDEQAKHFCEELFAVCQDQFGQSDTFCVKDPRASRLFPIWQPVLDRLGAEAKAIIIFRHPHAVAASVMKRNELPSGRSPFAYGSVIISKRFSTPKRLIAALSLLRLL